VAAGKLSAHRARLIDQQTGSHVVGHAASHAGPLENDLVNGPQNQRQVPTSGSGGAAAAAGGVPLPPAIANMHARENAANINFFIDPPAASLAELR